MATIKTSIGLPQRGRTSLLVSPSVTTLRHFLHCYETPNNLAPSYFAWNKLTVPLLEILLHTAINKLKMKGKVVPVSKHYVIMVCKRH
jgi:hypothetical protein